MYFYIRGSISFVKYDMSFSITKVKCPNPSIIFLYTTFSPSYSASQSMSMGSDYMSAVPPISAIGTPVMYFSGYSGGV